MKTIEHYGPNEEGRDFLCSDIHGCFADLFKLLKKEDFNPDVDRLFSVGDLIDRGPYSDQAIHFWNKPWFHAVVGNHELFLHESVQQYGVDGPTDPLWLQNGGEWWLDVDLATRERFSMAVDNLPYLIEVEVGGKMFGIVHAEIPIGYSWEGVTNAVEDNNPAIKDMICWSRDRVSNPHSNKHIVEDMDLVFSGHTILRHPVKYGNHWWIDTGSFLKHCMEYKLSDEERAGCGITLFNLTDMAKD